MITGYSFNADKEWIMRIEVMGERKIKWEKEEKYSKRCRRNVRKKEENGSINEKENEKNKKMQINKKRAKNKYEKHKDKKY